MSLAGLVASVFTAATALTSPLSNPPASDAPTAAFAAACYGARTPTVACDRAAIADINTARALEGLGPIVLPANYLRLGIKAKMAAVTNAERTSRGLPKLRQTSSDNQLATLGAAAGRDPIGPAGHGWGSIWAGVADPLAADFLWMYEDGPNSPNLDCPKAGAPGCWGHRDNILSPYWSTIGSAASGPSLAQLFVQ